MDIFWGKTNLASCSKSWRKWFENGAVGISEYRNDSSR